ncbi:MAG: hypothetical protein RLN96_06315, partial [Pseudomonadales bacterium]
MPKSLAPQQYASPFVVMPHVVADPAFIEPKVSPPETGTGTRELSTESRPRIQSSPRPQQKAFPSVVTPQVCANPE